MITSVGNAQVKNLVQLQKKARERKKQHLYVAEGIRMFREAPAEAVEKVYVSEAFYSNREHRALLESCTFEILSDEVFLKVSDTKTPQGILCLMRMRERSLWELLDETQGSTSGLFLVLENVQDPGNLGTMFRTGEGAGISGIIMDSATADIYNPKTVRSTMGSLHRVPFCITQNLTEAVAALKSRQIRTYAAYLAGSVCYDEPDYRSGTAFLIGNEGNGLTEETAALADARIRIPMGGQLESLNAAMAAGILMYEANRQRRR